jgi:predicted PurR-regulated permease PerM
MGLPENSASFQVRGPGQSGFGSVRDWLIAIITAGVVLVLLVEGQLFLIPLVVAILLFILITAMIDFIAGLKLGPFRVPVWAATLVTFAAIIVTVAGLFAIVSRQMAALPAQLPTYLEQMRAMLAASLAWLGDDTATSIVTAIQDVDAGAYLRTAAGSAGNLVVATGLVALYVGFLFAERQWFLPKLQRLFPNDDEADDFVAEMIGSISRSVRHYMLVHTAVSLLTAVLVYVILVLLGVDFAEALAVFALVLNFIPNIGSIVATVLPTLVALVQFGDWPTTLLVFALIGLVQLSIGNVLEPMLMGRRLHLSSFAIILSLTFWGAIWGVAGMFLAVPMMVMLAIVCAHFEAARPIAVLLSRDGTIPRSPSSHTAQRRVFAPSSGAETRDVTSERT